MGLRKHIQTPIGRYVEQNDEMEKKLFGGKKLTVEQIEDLHWRMILEKKSYALNNDISLFGNGVQHFNLDRFTNAESNIHDAETHHGRKVS